jgi:hypothetical protein
MSEEFQFNFYNHTIALSVSDDANEDGMVDCDFMITGNGEALLSALLQQMEKYKHFADLICGAAEIYKNKS